jgi:hypothetical protein
MNFRLWMETTTQYPWQRPVLPWMLQGLAAEARKAPTFHDFEMEYIGEIKHGLYYHWTDDPNFFIDPEKGPRDMSSMGSPTVQKGKLMITSHLAAWEDYGKRNYVAIIDMSNVPRKAYYQVKRGFGNEFFVNDPSQARVVKVVNKQQAKRIDRELDKLLPQSEEQLQDFFSRWGKPVEPPVPKDPNQLEFRFRR